MRLMIIEDDSDIRDSLQQLLLEEGYEVVTEHDGYVALLFLQEHPEQRPDLIILDLAMPIMNGFDFREQQLTMDGVCDIPVACVSAMHLSNWMRDKLGADAYLQKPFTTQQLNQTIQKLMAGKG